MARVPGVPGASVGQDKGALRVEPTAGAFGALALADGLEGLAKATGREADSLARHAEMQATLDAKALSDDHSIALEQEQALAVDKFRSENPGILATQNLPTVFKELDGLREQRRGQLTSPLAQRLYDEATRRNTVGLMNGLSSWANGERRTYRINQFKAVADNLARTATIDNTEEVFKTAEPQFRAMGAELKWSEEMFKSAFDNFKGDTVYSLIQGTAARNPALAQATYDKYESVLSPQQKGVLLNQIQASEDNHAVAEVADGVASVAALGGISQWRAAIAGIETGGRRNDYGTVGPASRTGDKPYGKYQVMGANIGPWTKEVLGKTLTPQQFLASPDAQEKVFAAKFGGYVEKYGSPEEAASHWFTGRSRAEGAKLKDVLGTSGAEYVRRFSAANRAVDNLQANAPEAYDAIARDPRLRGDPLLINRAQSAFLSNLSQAQTIRNAQMQEAQTTLYSAYQATGETDVAKLTASSPQLQAAWTALSPKAQMVFQNSLTAEGNKWDPVKEGRYRELLGEAANQPQKFLGRKLEEEDLPRGAVTELYKKQLAIQKKEKGATAASASINTLLKNAFVQQAIKTSGLEKDTPGYNEFTGALAAEYEGWVADHPGKKPTSVEIGTMANNLMAQRAIPGRHYREFFGAKFYDDSTTVNAPTFHVPQGEAATLAQQFKARYGRDPSASEVAYFYRKKSAQ